MTSQRRKIVSPVPKWDIAAKSLRKVSLNNLKIIERIFNLYLPFSILQKQYAVFDFVEERPNRYLIVPDTWINGNKCYWPDPESKEEE